MRHDEGLDDETTRIDTWDADPVSGRSGDEVERYLQSSERKGRMSLSGSERNHLFVKGASGAYVDVSGNSGIDSPSDGRSIAMLDIDRDGSQDLLLTSTNEHLLRIFRNRVPDLGSRSSFIGVRLVGGNTGWGASDGFSSRDGIGARITLTVGDRSLLRELRAGEGFAAQHSRTLVFGLGDASEPSSIEIRWPSGRRSSLSDVAPGTLVTVYEDHGMSPDGTGFSLARYRPEGRPVTDRKARRTPFPVSHPGASGVRVYTAMATWCGSCKRELPALERLQNAFDGSVSFYGLPIDEDDLPPALERYAAKFSPAYELLGPDGARARAFTALAQERLREAGLPFSAIVARDGTVVDVVRGVPTVSDLRRALSQR